MPYLTILAALEKSKNPDIVVKIRKDNVEGFLDISGAALKKAKKTLQEKEKKAQKVAEKAIADAEKNAKQAIEDAIKLEEAKKVVLVQDASLVIAKKVCNCDTLYLLSHLVNIMR